MEATKVFTVYDLALLPLLADTQIYTYIYIYGYIRIYSIGHEDGESNGEEE